MMAERRMFAKTIVTSDAFLDLPASTRSLYFLLGMMADDDGFVNNPSSIMRMSGATTDDLKLLIAKRFVLTFESGVVVIKHWCIHNTIQKDRYKATKYQEEKSTLRMDKNNGYTVDVSTLDTGCIQSVSNLEPQVRLGKDRLVEGRLIESIGDGSDHVETTPKRKRFIPPTLDEVKAYCQERGNNVDPERFMAYYESNGWMVGRNKMKDWKAAVRSWERSCKPSRSGGGNPFLDMMGG